MHGTKKYAPLFETGQYGKLYIVSGHHARGKTFRIYVLPEGEVAKSYGPENPPLNCNAVEVYGVVSGNPGWSECYGWLHRGKWQEDFEKLVAEKENDKLILQVAEDIALAEKVAKAADKISELLNNY